MASSYSKVNGCSVTCWKGDLVVASPGGSPDMVSWWSGTVSASRSEKHEPLRCPLLYRSLKPKICFDRLRWTRLRDLCVVQWLPQTPVERFEQRLLCVSDSFICSFFVFFWKRTRSTSVVPISLPFLHFPSQIVP